MSTFTIAVLVGLVCTAISVGFALWRHSRTNPELSREQRQREAEGKLRSAGVEDSLLARGLELLEVTPAAVHALFGQEEIFRESAARLVQEAIERGVDPLEPCRELLAIGGRLGFQPPPAHASGCRLDARLLLSVENGAEVLDARVVETADEALGLVTEMPSTTDPGGLASVGALFAVDDEVATCKCEVRRTEKLEGERCYWQVMVPDGVAEMARRNQRRIALQIAARVVVTREDVAFVQDAEAVDREAFKPAFLVDMSLGGVRLRLSSTVEIGDRVWISVGREDRRSEVLELSGKVVWSNRHGKGHASTVGIEFDEPSPQMRKQLLQFLSNQPEPYPGETRS